MGRLVQLRLTVFTLGVLMLLLRPYCVYQMTARDARNDPSRAWSLLQRLVKKKDEHHREQVPACLAILNLKAAVRPERKVQGSFAAFLAFLFAPLAIHPAPVFYLIPVSQRYRYRSLSCLLI